MSIAVASAADKEKPFRPNPADTYQHRQTVDKVTVAADPYDAGEEKIKAAFGKADPYEEGVLPVLVVIQNDSGKTIRLDSMQLRFVSNRSKVEPTPAAEVKYVKGVKRPGVVTGPQAAAGALFKKKNPLAAPEIEQRAFEGKMIPPGNSASGFFYFQAKLQPGDSLYLSGLKEADTGRELFYYEIPLK
jgi:hypothetical protein